MAGRSGSSPAWRTRCSARSCSGADASTTPKHGSSAPNRSFGLRPNRPSARSSPHRGGCWSSCAAGGTSRALERALDLAEPEGLLLPFLLFPAPDLLERHARVRTAHAALVADILTLLAGQTPPTRADDVQALQDPLSESELRVL